jgi:hypothetical protein
VARYTLNSVFMALLLAASLSAQSHPDLTGIWTTTTADTADISPDLLPGEVVSLTPYGAERYKKVDMANSPSYHCLPYGPTRAMQATNPFQIVQTPDLVTMIFEHIDYRLIYTDGRGHPEDILDYPEWMGHSIGRWEGDTLVVDTIGLREETWLDTNGYEHSDKLHLIERFQKTGADTFRWTVTVEDPVFYTKPFTYARTGRRMKNTRIMPARCADNEQSAADAIPGAQGPIHKIPPTFPK